MRFRARQDDWIKAALVKQHEDAAIRTDEADRLVDTAAGTNRRAWSIDVIGDDATRDLDRRAAPERDDVSDGRSGEGEQNER